ncbi:MAG: deoxyribose-phosphate aldolase [Anaerolineales bacterium]|nr:deoxyribose-phosphate aldolase [Anaerolineales bacterium]
MDAVSPRTDIAQWIRALQPRVRPALEAVGGPLEPLLSVAQARPLSLESVRIAGLLDQTLLRPEVTPAQIERGCDEAMEHRFAAVYVHSGYVARVAARLAGSDVAPASVAGFPMGANLTAVKVYEARAAIAAGAREIDMVLAIGLLKSGAFAEVAEDLADVTRAAHAHGVLVKLILETGLLTDEEKVAACLLAAGTGIDFVKTSTGLVGGGATVADVALMRQVVGDRVGVKAAGGIRSLADARAMVSAGATRLGTSAGVNIAQQAVGEAAAPMAAAGY